MCRRRMGRCQKGGGHSCRHMHAIRAAAPSLWGLQATTSALEALFHALGVDHLQSTAGGSVGDFSLRSRHSKGSSTARTGCQLQQAATARRQRPMHSSTYAWRTHEAAVGGGIEGQAPARLQPLVLHKAAGALKQVLQGTRRRWGWTAMGLRRHKLPQQPPAQGGQGAVQERSKAFIARLAHWAWQGNGGKRGASSPSSSWAARCARTSA